MRKVRSAADFVSLGATITILPSTAARMAPHVVHVSAANSIVVNGTLATALFQWTATGTAIAGGTMTYTDPRPGKSAVTYNGYTDQRGFNAAFICWSAGRIHITLTITDELGVTYTTAADVDVVADTRTVVYCDEGLATGANDGSSEANAFRDFETDCVPYMQASGATPTRLRLNRGKTYITTTVNLMVGTDATNVWFDSYGTGAPPLIDDTQTSGPANGIDIRRDAENVFIQNWDFRGHANRIVNALRFRTDTKLVNVAVINCNFDRVAQATNTTENPNYLQGFLQMNCHVDDHFEYGFYGEYDDAVFLGNTSTNTAQQNESSIRTSGFRMSWDCTYSKFIHPTSNKDAFRVMTRDQVHGGEYIWIARSQFIGPVQLAWNSDPVNPGDGKFQVFEDNYSEPNDTAASNTWLNIGNNGSAYEDITIRGNVFCYTGSGGNVNAPIATGATRTSTRLVVIDNTIVQNGDVMSFDADGDNFRIERNLIISSRDAYAGAGLAYFFKAGAVIIAGNNVWTPGNVVNVNGEGNLSLVNWNAREGTADDFAQTGLDVTDIVTPRFRPALALTTVLGPYAKPRGARTTDYHGNTRLGGAGAVDEQSVALVYADGTGDFTTIEAWRAAVVGLSGVHDAECKGNVGALSIAPGTWTPSSSRIYVANGQGHNLDLTGTSFGTSANTIDAASGITIDGMRGGTLTVLPIAGATASFTVKNSNFTSIIVAASISTPATVFNFTCTNNVSITDLLVDCYDLGTGNGATVNATISGCFVGDELRLIEQDGTGTSILHAIVKNCMAASFTSDIINGSHTAANNLSANGTADDFGGSGHIVNKALSAQVINVNNNWKLKLGADAIDAGATLAEVTPDAIGIARPIGLAYDIGPHEFDAALFVPEAGGTSAQIMLMTLEDFI